ncbi:MAG: hypothetical protein ACKOMW_00025, partial [Actinomycetes bacterium]
MVNCDNGVVVSSVGGCIDSRCSVGGYSGMRPQIVNSSTSSNLGLCDIGYDGSYSYSCEKGVAQVTDLCFENCQFSTIGISLRSLKQGKVSLKCDNGYSGSGVDVSCNDGKATIESGMCYLDGNCSVGVGTGMESKIVPFGTSKKSDGKCSTGYSGSYSYSCSSAGVAEVSNNCRVANCKVGEDLGMISKNVGVGTSGVNGECASSYGGFYSWSCSSSGVGSIVENNCINYCDVGTPEQGLGMVKSRVGFGRSGTQGVCDSANGYVGNYSWSCNVNSSTGKVQGVVLANNCKNTCDVGTSVHGVGMLQKSVIINSSGSDGQCISGYGGNYEWSCDSNGSGRVILNKCVNKCVVGASNTGLISKEVSLGTSGTNGVCNSSLGYTGNYSWNCSSSGVGSITTNNCVLRTCNIGGSSGMKSRVVNAGTDGVDGLCENGYFGFYKWSCNFNGVSSVINSCSSTQCALGKVISGAECVDIKCDIEEADGYTSREVAFGTSSFACNKDGYQGLLSYNCSVPGIIKPTGICTKISCNVSAGVGYSARSVFKGSGVFNCNSDHSGTLSYNCLTDGSNITATGTCTPIKCNIPASDGYAAFIANYGIGSINCNLATGFKGRVPYDCKAGGVATISGLCSPIKCEVSDAEGYSGRTLNFGASTFACNSGFSGQVSYDCQSSGSATIVNNCVKLKCNIPAQAGYFARQVDVGSGNFACDVSNYSGTLSYKCSQSGSSTSLTLNGVCNNIGFDLNWGYQTSLPTNSFVSQSSNNSLEIVGPSLSSSAITQYSYAITTLDSSVTKITFDWKYFNSYDTASTDQPGYFLNNVWYPLATTGVSSANGSITINLTGSSNTFGAGIYTTNSMGSAGVLTLSNIIFTKTNSVISSCNITSTSSYDGASVAIGTGSLPCANGYSGALNYVCANTGIATLTNNCSKISCTIASGTGYTSRTVDYGSNSFSCDDVSYTGKLNYSCLTSGAIVPSGACTKITCQIADNALYKGRTVQYGSGTFECLSGFSGSVSYSCVKGGAITPTSTCSSVKCTIDEGAGYLGREVSFGNGTFACDKTNYKGDLSYNCSSGGFISPSGTCTLKSCDIPSTSSYDGRSVQVGSGSFKCKFGYEGTVSYSCSSLEVLTTSNTCVQTICSTSSVTGFNNGTVISYSPNDETYFCNDITFDQTKTASFTCNISKTFTNTNTTTNNCAKITCSIPSSFNSTSTGQQVFIGTNQSLTCASGYYGVPKYSCAGTTYSRSDGANVAGNPGIITQTGTACSAVTCTLPAGNGYSAKSALAYTSNSSTGLTTTCDQTGYTGTISYFCPDTPTSTSVAGSIVSGSSCGCATGYAKNASQVCVSIMCSSASSVNGFVTGTQIPYNASSTNYYCNATNYNQTNTITFPACTTQASTLSPTTNNCTLITCPISSSTLNVNETSVNVGTGNLTCKTGFYYSTQPTYNCSTVNSIRADGQSVPTSGSASTSGSCTSVNCNVPASANLSVSSVPYTLTATSATCATGFAYGATQPTYTCSASGNNALGTFAIANGGTCSAITCTVPANTAGFVTGTTGINFGTASYSCNAPNYSTSSTASFTCATNGNSTTGTFTQNSNSCVCNSGFAKDASNNCVAITCTIPSNINVTQGGASVNFNTNSQALTCASGYIGSPTYTCTGTTNPGTFTAGGTACAPVTCSIPAGTGYSAKVVNVGQSSFTCDAAGYTGNISYDCSCTSSSTISLASNTSYNTSYSCQDIVLHTFAQNSTLTNVSVNYSARDQGWGNDCSYGHFLVHDFVSWLFYSPIDIPQSSSYQYRSYNWTPNVSVSAGSRVEINVCSPYPGCQAYVQGFNASITFSSQGGGSCSSPSVTTSGTCTPITCAISAGTGYTARTLNFGSGTFTCDAAGHTGSISYNCNAQNTPNLSGTCTPITCSVSAGTGYTARTLNFGSGTFTCDAAGHTGSISYNCNAQNTPNLSGTCTPITCSVSAGTGYTARTLNFGSGTFTCNAAGYNGSISYNCNAQNTPNLSGT